MSQSFRAGALEPRPRCKLRAAELSMKRLPFYNTSHPLLRQSNAPLSDDSLARRSRADRWDQSSFENVKCGDKPGIGFFQVEQKSRCHVAPC